MSKHTFVLSDESINTEGFRVLTGGIDLSDFMKNPLMLWMHKRPFEDNVLPIGRWDNIRIENGRLLADAVFDTNDSFARSIKDKVENGFLRMASAGLEPLEFSNQSAHMLPGQVSSTLIRSLMVEASIVDIGANRNAVKLYDQSQRINLSFRPSGQLTWTALLNSGLEAVKAYKKAQPESYKKLYKNHYGFEPDMRD